MMETNQLSLTFLGTGTSQGIPIIGCQCEVCSSTDSKDKRLRVSVLFTYEKQHLLIDIGPDFRQQMLANNFTNVDQVLLTHEHNDHTSGLDDIRPINFAQNTAMKVFGLRRVLQALAKRFDYVFESDYPGKPIISLQEISPSVPLYWKNIEILPVEVLHGSLPILGYKVGDIAYLTDVKTIAEDSIQLLKGVKILIINALRHEEHHSHLTLAQALDLINMIAPAKAYLTHISHDLGKHEDIQSILPSNVYLAFDGLTITV